MNSCLCSSSISDISQEFEFMCIKLKKISRELFLKRKKKNSSHLKADAMYWSVHKLFTDCMMQSEGAF